MSAAKMELLSRMRALGNTHRGFKEVASDLVNQYREQGGDFKSLADGTYLSPNTLDRISKLTETKQGDPYRPNADTCERIFRYFGAEVNFSTVTIKSTYRNKPKF